ncbi:MAG: carbohydrate porin, partial [Succinivibrio sp.]
MYCSTLKEVHVYQAASVLAASVLAPAAQANYTPNAYFGGYFRSGVMSERFNKNDDLVHRVGRLGAENDTYGEIFLGADVAQVDDTVWTVNSRMALSAQYNRDWQSTNNVQVNGNNVSTDNVENVRIALREFNLNVKGLFDSDPEASVWAGKRFYHREDLHITDMYYYDISGMGAGVENLSLADGKLSVAWLRRDDGASYKSNYDGTDVTVKGGQPSFASVHMIDVQYDHSLWDGANLELRGTYFIPQRDTHDNAKKWYSASNEYKQAQLFAAELTQGFSGGWNKTVVQYAHGSNVKWGAFGTPAWLDTDGDANHAYRWTLINTGEFHITENLGLCHVLYGSYASGYDNNIFFRAKNSAQYAGAREKDMEFQIVVRPYYKL